ncbi:transposase [Enhygromyxa salina]|uniref:Transposase n=2 Tax=Enhygromyxa salina TaxID=215803 RepID=A0A0C2D8T9_9BACT|nr:transposase [Enhygromyxa salina]
MLFAPGNNAAELTNFIGYCLAHNANRYGVQVHASLWMSDHHHTDVTDPEANLAPFKQQLHSLAARGRNTQLGRFDSVWSGDAPCDTARPTDDESLMDLVYTLTNPVKAGLVKWSRQWPGFSTIGWRFGETRTFKRPSWFFDAGGDMPKEVSLTLARPPIFPELDDDELYAKLMEAVREREIEIHRSMRARGRRFMGLRKLEKQSWNSEAQSYEERFTVAPQHAGSSKQQVLVEVGRDREWKRQYAAARALLLAGKPAVFPAGTYWLRRFAGVNVAAQAP